MMYAAHDTSMSAKPKLGYTIFCIVLIEEIKQLVPDAL